MSSCPFHSLHALMISTSTDTPRPVSIGAQDNVEPYIPFKTPSPKTLVSSCRASWPVESFAGET